MCITVYKFNIRVINKTKLDFEKLEQSVCHALKGVIDIYAINFKKNCKFEFLMALRRRLQICRGVSLSFARAPHFRMFVIQVKSGIIE